MARPGKKKAGWLRYLKEAFTYRWNLLFFGGAAAAADRCRAADPSRSTS